MGSSFINNLTRPKGRKGRCLILCVNCPMSWGRTTIEMCVRCDKFVSITKVENNPIVACCPTGKGQGCVVVFDEDEENNPNGG